MHNFQDGSGWRRIAYSKIIIFVVLVLIVIIGKATYSVYLKYSGNVDSLTREKTKLSSLESRKADLSDKINRLQTGQGTEETIRDKYGMAKEGEQMIVFVGKKDDVTTSTPELKLSFWDKVKSLFSE
ncbi:MAG: septum formation initiator family protein [bacterium]